jgi:hypothetical protein
MGKPMAIHPLIISGTLILASGQSYEFPSRGQPLWFSKEGVLSIQSMAGKNLIRPLQEGIVFSSGLIPSSKGKSDSGPTPIHIYSSKDVQTIKKCPHPSLDFSSYPPTLSLGPDQFSSFVKGCPLSKVTLSPDYTPTWERHLQKVEAKLLRQGFQISRAPNSKVLGFADRPTLSVPFEQVDLLKEELGPLAAVYDFAVEEGISKPGRTLLMDLSLLEISRSQLESIGLKLPTQMEATLSPEWSAEFPAKLLASLSKNKGAGKLLAQPRMRVKPGEKAKFSSGGELAFKQQNRHGEQILWKSYGLNLTLEPDPRVKTGAGEISVNVTIDFSEPDLSAPTDGLPGISHRKLESRFDLRTGEASVLGTLSLRRIGNTQQGPAALSWFPSLEKLLSHHQNSQVDSELWLVMKPSWEEIPIAQYRAREGKIWK